MSTRDDSTASAAVSNPRSAKRRHRVVLLEHLLVVLLVVALLVVYSLATVPLKSATLLGVDRFQTDSQATSADLGSNVIPSHSDWSDAWVSVLFSANPPTDRSFALCDQTCPVPRGPPGLLIAQQNDTDTGGFSFPCAPGPSSFGQIAQGDPLPCADNYEIEVIANPGGIDWTLSWQITYDYNTTVPLI